MAVRKVQLEYCYKSNYFAPSDDILTLQRYGVFLKLPNFGAANAINACISFLLPKGEKCGVAMLSRENRWSSKSHHACMFGRVVTEVNAVKIRLKVKFSSIKKPHCPVDTGL
jgi:hypothetical protein